MSAEVDLAFVTRCIESLETLQPWRAAGQVLTVRGRVVEAEGLRASVGALCEIETVTGDAPLEAEVVGFRDGRLLLMPLGEPLGVAPGASLKLLRRELRMPDARSALGRIVDARGIPLDGGPPLRMLAEVTRAPERRPTLSRQRISAPLDLGVRSLNALLTCGRGGRLGLFSGSGVGKSTLLGQIARHTRADANVVALIGERGREVREFVEEELGDALAHSIVVVATSDESALLRRRCAWLATGLAEQLRSDGDHVLLLMDSITRFAAAIREIGLAAGEPPATRGFPPSLWAELPRLVERAGLDEGDGSITAIYTVLVEGDDLDEPVADAVRGLLDGHVVLSRALAGRGQFPAIDLLASVSRLMNQVVPPDHLARAQRARQVLATYEDARDLVSVGAYVSGSDAATDEALRLEPVLRAMMEQPQAQGVSLADSAQALAVALGASATVAEAA